MDDRETRSFAGKLLDSGLKRWGDVSPRPGLDGRVLARVRAAQQRRSRLAWTGSIAAAAVAAMMAVGVFNLAHRGVRPTPQPAPKRSAQALPQMDVKSGESIPLFRAALRSSGALKRSENKTAISEPRQAVFPSPQPLTEEEILLVQYVRNTSASTRAAVSAQDEVIQDVEIEPLYIAPLTKEETESTTEKRGG